MSVFPDANLVSGYAADALQWAVAERLVNGTVVSGTTCLAPQATATRAQVATILMRFLEGVGK